VTTPEPIAISGVGCVTAFGDGVGMLQAGWRSGDCAISDGLGYCADFSPKGVLTASEIRRTDRYAQMALVACDEAAVQSGWHNKMPYEPHRVGCVVATTSAGQSTVERERDVLRDKGARAVAPLRIMLAAPDSAAVLISMRLNLQGECYGLLGACAGGAQAIGVGVRMIRSGVVDAAVVGGADAALPDVVRAMYTNLGAMSPSGICRPFDRRRDGMLPGEGAGVLILERAAGARRRGAQVLGEITGYSAGSDAHHLTMPQEAGQVRATRAVLRDASLDPSEVTYVNAHGTGTKLNDAVETAALKAVFGGHAHRLLISSLKSSIGHLQGAAGAVEAIATLMALRDRVVPPTVGLEEPDDGLDLDYVPLRARPLPGDGTGPITALSNSFGLGGHNACLTIRA
jgi:3-oxoacyl-[acyl-carrier-protein] synthase II